MWNKVLGKSSDVSSQDGSRRKGDSSSSKRERRAESVVSSGSSRVPPSSRSDDRSERSERHPSRSSTFPLQGPPSVASSYATAPSDKYADSDSTIKPSSSRSRSENKK